MAQSDVLTAEEEKRLRAQNIIFDHVFWGAWAGVVPIPIIDWVFISSLQLKMMRELCVEYGIKFERSQARAFIFSLTGGGATAAATVGFSLGKFSPAGIGFAVSLAAVAGASTYAVGNIFLRHLEKGYDLTKLPTREGIKDEYNALLEEGKVMVQSKTKSFINKCN